VIAVTVFPSPMIDPYAAAVWLTGSGDVAGVLIAYALSKNVRANSDLPGALAAGPASS
jgi:hypothetical protein